MEVRTLLGIQADLKKAVVWMVCTRPLTSKSFNSYTDPLGTWSSVPIRVITIIILLIYDFFTPTLADSFSLESKWQQVSLSFQDTS